ncbi:MAG TPA: hypothetical protein DDZ51_22815 [Planctomycetaceae bacterium]|nr:hypothetical protein [Planctomycetaceae bacterium]
MVALRPLQSLANFAQAAQTANYRAAQPSTLAFLRNRYNRHPPSILIDQTSDSAQRFYQALVSQVLGSICSIQDAQAIFRF